MASSDRHYGVESPPAGALVVPALEAPEVELSLVVPTLDERANIGTLLGALREVLDAQPLRGYEVVVVDDDSPDQTWRVAAEQLGTWPALRVVRRRHQRGPATAVARGWQCARGDILGTINADLQHPPELLPRMLAALDGADLVVASRYVDGGAVGAWPAHRRLGSRAARRVGRVLLPQVFGRVADPLSGYYLLRRKVIAARELAPLGYKSLIEVLARGRSAAVRECPYTMRQRGRGTSKLGPQHAAESSPMCCACAPPRNAADGDSRSPLCTKRLSALEPGCPPPGLPSTDDRREGTPRLQVCGLPRRARLRPPRRSGRHRRTSWRSAPRCRK